VERSFRASQSKQQIQRPGIVATVISNEAGAYQFASLQTGTYSVNAELPGFRTQTYCNVTLGVSQQVRLNFTLQVGDVAQNVEVTEAADTLIATTSSSVGSVLPEYKVRDLPLVGGTFWTLFIRRPVPDLRALPLQGLVTLRAGGSAGPTSRATVLLYPTVDTVSEHSRRPTQAPIWSRKFV
jgi:hypothetical protein